MTTTPGFLRGVATADIIGALHNAHTCGPWALESLYTVEHRNVLTFAVGIVHPGQEDQRERVRVTVEDPETPVTFQVEPPESLCRHCLASWSECDRSGCGQRQRPGWRTT